MIRQTMIVITVLGAGLLPGQMSARADSTADCGRFYLRYNPETKQKECVRGKRKSGTAQRARRQQRDLGNDLSRLAQVLTGADAILRTSQLTKAERRRVQQLLTEARERVEALKRVSRELEQQQQTRDKGLQTAADQRIQSQIQMTQQLERKQIDLTRRLEADVRQRDQSIRRRRGS